MLRRLWHFLWIVRKTYLTKSARLYYSQFGEDAVLREIIDPKLKDGFFVDVGAYHPTKFSNTYRLYHRGWRGINIEMDPIKIETFKLKRRGDLNICAAVSNERAIRKVYNFHKFGLGSTIDEDVATAARHPVISVRDVETTTLDEILRASPYADREIDLLSIDAEGHDYQVLRSLDIGKYRPKIVVVESELSSIDEILESPIYTHLAGCGYRLAGWIKPSLIFRVQQSELFGTFR